MATLAIDSSLFAATPQLGYWWDGEPGTHLCAPVGESGTSRGGSPQTPIGVVPTRPERFAEGPQRSRR